MKPKKQELRKVTVMLPRDLVQRATRTSGLGITAAIRKGLEAVAATDAYQKIRKMRGKWKFALDLKELRRD